jgi:cell fate regulator YaaT (PSP1 superfamily)
MQSVVGVRFQKLGKLYHFSAGNHQDIEPGDHVIVETKRGRQLGQVIGFIEPDKVFSKGRLRPIRRKANPRDLVMQQVWQEKELSALITCRDKAHDMGVKDVKFVKAEYSFDGSWLIFYYNTENRKLRLTKLRNSLGNAFNCRVDMQLIGPRDVAKILGGYGACGQPRCCSTFLTEFSPISIRMAKEQGISLNPNEITGMCGRLRCCLIFEYEQYVAAKKQLPRYGKTVGTPEGDGRVVDVRAMRDAVLVQLADGRREEFTREQLEPLAELKALQEKAEQGCSKHEGGGCDCGANKNGDN